MIVKNETKTLPRLFESLHEVIDYYVISDTGSTDGTPELIEKEMEKYGVPGEIHHDPWKNFGHNRNIALQHAAKANVNYIFIIDADEKFEYNDKNFTSKLSKDWYDVKRFISGNYTYYLPAILRVSNGNEIGWEWRGPVHNYIVAAEEWKKKLTREQLQGVMIHAQVGGAKSHGVTDKEKYLRDAKLLSEELKENPNDTRSQFYLAQSYRDAKENDLAIEHYLKRAEMGGWNEEVYYSYFQAARIKKLLGAPYEEFMPLYVKAYGSFPHRVEALYDLVSYCRLNKKYFEGYLFGKTAFEILNKGFKGVLFLEKSVHEYKLYDEFSVCAYWSGHFQDCLNCCKKLLKEKKMPESMKDRVKKNMVYSLNKIMNIND
jgi:glycosyltransferase involved in cell wall biosynthesis